MANTTYFVIRHKESKRLYCSYNNYVEFQKDENDAPHLYHSADSAINNFKVRLRNSNNMYDRAVETAKRCKAWKSTVKAYEFPHKPSMSEFEAIEIRINIEIL